MFKPTTFTDIRRLKAPTKWQRIDTGKSPRGAIEEKCRDCCQTHTDVEDCPIPKCPLFPYRPGANKPGATQRRDGDIPDYDQLIDAWRASHPEAVARGKALGLSSQQTTCDICLKQGVQVTTRGGVAYCVECDEDNR